MSPKTDHVTAGATVSAFTPGPWTRYDYRIFKLTPDGNLAQPPEFIAYTANAARNRTPEAEANARLIAAAPDLLAVCQRVLAHLDGTSGEIDAVAELSAVIAKAEGR